MVKQIAPNSEVQSWADASNADQVESCRWHIRLPTRSARWMSKPLAKQRPDSCISFPRALPSVYCKGAHQAKEAQEGLHPSVRGHVKVELNEPSVRSLAHASVLTGRGFLLDAGRGILEGCIARVLAVWGLFVLELECTCTYTYSGIARVLVAWG